MQEEWHIQYDYDYSEFFEQTGMVHINNNQFLVAIQREHTNNQQFRTISKT